MLCTHYSKRWTPHQDYMELSDFCCYGNDIHPAYYYACSFWYCKVLYMYKLQYLSSWLCESQPTILLGQGLSGLIRYLLNIHSRIVIGSWVHQTSLYFATFWSRGTFFGQLYISWTHTETSISSQPISHSPENSGGWEMGWLDRLTMRLAMHRQTGGNFMHGMIASWHIFTTGLAYTYAERYIQVYGH